MVPLAVRPVEGPGAAAGSRARLTPLSPGRFALQFTVDQETHEQLRYAQALLRHVVPGGDVAQVFSRALAVLVPELERTRFAATRRPRASRRHAAHSRHIPAAVKRAVWERDGGQCSFVSDAGQRCPACERLEFDHIDPVARDGEATVENIRLRCRAHNQYEAERLFGAGFMHGKREAARHRAEARREEARREAEAKREAARRQADALREAARREAEARRQAAEERARVAAAAAAEEADPSRSVVPWLRELGFKLDEIRRAVAQCEFPPDATIEDKIRAALRFLAPKSARRVLHVTAR